MKKNNFTIHKKIYILFALLLLLLPVFFLYCGFKLEPQYNETFLGELKYKLQLLETAPGKRIVMIGGSNVPFSMKSNLLAEAFPEYEIIDFGLYAELGTGTMLDLAKINVHEGDIYLIIPEQNNQTLSSYFSSVDIWQALDGDFSYLAALDSSRYEKLASAYPAFAANKLFYYINGKPSTDTIYTRASFNIYGDISSEKRSNNIMNQGYNPNNLISFSDSIITSDFINEMNEFAAEVIKQGATVYYHFPPMNQLALTDETTKTQINNYYDILQNQLTFPILGNPHKSILESGWFYDTNFHLNDSGATYYTTLMIEDLKILFSDTSITDISNVTMPEIAFETSDLLDYHNNRDTDCFTYEATENGYLITGLSSNGLEASELIIPASYESLQVIGVTETAFQNSDSLYQLTIPSNIGILYDNMFINCTNLHSIILTGAPSDYSIGNNLMSGRNFLILVSSDELNNYKIHYSWQQYDSYLAPYSKDEITYEN